MPITSDTVTRGVRVSVRSQFLPDESSPLRERYVFAYTVTIDNSSNDVVQLQSRHWVVAHGDGHIEEVRGPGVVGEQPVLRPGEGFQYTSGCVLRTPRGTMHGAYEMITPTGERFLVEIGRFLLEMPHALN